MFKFLGIDAFNKYLSLTYLIANIDSTVIPTFVVYPEPYGFIQIIVVMESGRRQRHSPFYARMKTAHEVPSAGENRQAAKQDEKNCRKPFHQKTYMILSVGMSA